MSTWERTYINPGSGGFVVTELNRKRFGQTNKQERLKYEKEQRMCRQFADFGFQIEHLAEQPGVSSPDTNIVSFGRFSSIVRINGVKAELKSLSSHNNIQRHALEATRKQGAQIVLFEFTKNDGRGRILQEIEKLSHRRIHGYYYFSGDAEPTRF